MRNPAKGVVTSKAFDSRRAAVSTHAGGLGGCRAGKCSQPASHTRRVILTLLTNSSFAAGILPLSSTIGIVVGSPGKTRPFSGCNFAAQFASRVDQLALGQGSLSSGVPVCQGGHSLQKSQALLLRHMSSLGCEGCATTSMQPQSRQTAMHIWPICASNAALSWSASVSAAACTAGAGMWPTPRKRRGCQRPRASPALSASAADCVRPSGTPGLSGPATAAAWATDRRLL